MASLTYPIILASGMIVSASFWALESFPYTSYANLIYNCIPNLLISIAVGILLDLTFNFNRRRTTVVRAI
jgi:hypothetical protein